METKVLRLFALLLMLFGLCTLLFACDTAEQQTGTETSTEANASDGEIYVKDNEYPRSGTVEGGNYPQGDEPVSWFDAKVLSLHGGTVLVEAHEQTWVRNRCAKELYVSTKLYSGETVSGLEVGDMIRITYDGMIAESYPAQIFTVYGIEKIE